MWRSRGPALFAWSLLLAGALPAARADVPFTLTPTTVSLTDALRAAAEDALRFVRTGVPAGHCDTPITRGPAPGFCTDPVAAICESTYSRGERAWRLAKRLGDPSEHTGSPAPDPAQIRQAWDESRADLRRGIREQVGDPALQTRLNEILDHARLVTTDDTWPDEIINNEIILNEFSTAYAGYCGEDGRADAAFSYFLKRHGQRDNYVITCPGWLQAGPPGTSQRGNLLHVTTHELGHHFGELLPADFHARYLSCLLETYGHHFSDGSRAETVADFWAVRATAARLAAMPRAGYTEKLAVLRQAWAPLCGTDSPGYPSGSDRIGILLRTDPRIHALMGCRHAAGTAETAQGCTLQGAVPLPYLP